MEIETLEFGPKTHPDAILLLDSPTPSRKRPTIPTVSKPPLKRPCTIKLLDDDSDKAASLKATQNSDTQPTATQNSSTRNMSRTSRSIVHIPLYTHAPSAIEPRHPNNSRPSLPRAAKNPSKVAIPLDNLDLCNVEDSSTIIYEVPTTPDLNTLIALLAKENTKP